MSGETRSSISGWTVDTLREHLLSLRDADHIRYEQRFVATSLATDAALTAAERAVLKAEAASEKRFESVNEFRNTLADQQRTLISRTEVDVLMRGVNEKISALQKTQDAALAERTGFKGGWGLAVGLLGVVSLLAALLARFGP